MKAGDSVIVKYPFDAAWWKVEGVVIEQVESRLNVMKANCDMIQIDPSYLERIIS